MRQKPSLHIRRFLQKGGLAIDFHCALTFYCVLPVRFNCFVSSRRVASYHVTCLLHAEIALKLLLRLGKSEPQSLSGVRQVSFPIAETLQSFVSLSFTCKLYQTNAGYCTILPLASEDMCAPQFGMKPRNHSFQGFTNQHSAGPRIHSTKSGDTDTLTSRIQLIHLGLQKIDV